MKTAIIFSDNTKQIILTPESESEKTAIGMITENDNIEIALKNGSIYSCGNQEEIFTASLKQSRGGYLRVYNDDNSIILVLTPKTKQNKAYSELQLKQAFEAARKKNGKLKNMFPTFEDYIKF